MSTVSRFEWSRTNENHRRGARFKINWQNHYNIIAYYCDRRALAWHTGLPCERRVFRSDFNSFPVESSAIFRDISTSSADRLPRACRAEQRGRGSRRVTRKEKKNTQRRDRVPFTGRQDDQIKTHTPCTRGRWGGGVFPRYRTCYIFLYSYGGSYVTMIIIIILLSIDTHAECVVIGDLPSRRAGSMTPCPVGFLIARV